MGLKDEGLEVKVQGLGFTAFWGVYGLGFGV